MSFPRTRTSSLVISLCWSPDGFAFDPYSHGGGRAIDEGRMAKQNLRRWPIPKVPYGLALITRGVHAGRIGATTTPPMIPYSSDLLWGNVPRRRSFLC